MPEVPHPGEDHREAGFVRRGDHLVVANRSARLDYAGCAGFDGGVRIIGIRNPTDLDPCFQSNPVSEKARLRRFTSSVFPLRRQAGGIVQGS